MENNTKLNNANTETEYAGREVYQLNIGKQLLNNLGVGMLVVDVNMDIVYFNTKMGLFLKLQPADINKPFSDIFSIVNSICVKKILQTVVKNSTSIEKEVRIEDNLFQMNFLPNTSEAGTNDGALVTLVKITKIVTAQHLNENNKQLKDAIEQLESFAFGVSHDLRAPLRAISAYANIVLEENEGQLNESVVELIQAICNNAENMDRLIDGMLSFSRLGTKAVNKELVDMNAIITDVLPTLKVSYPHNVEVKVATLSKSYADLPLITQVWTNLLSNALKYSSRKDKPLIEIHSAIEGANVVYSIKDNGAGFNMDFAAKLFGMFQRLHDNSEFEGTGIGLANVKQIINRHGGKIWAKATVGEGATFSFSLPL